MAVSAENYPGSDLVAQEGDLLVHQATFRDRGCCCMHVGRWAGEYKTDPDARTLEHRPQVCEGFRVCGSEAEILPGHATGVVIRESICCAE
jgi:hypothetical protein